MTNELIVLRALKQGKRINQYDTTKHGLTVWFGLKRVKTHTTRLSDVIFKLRKQGYLITTNWETNGSKRWAEYKLEGK